MRKAIEELRQAVKQLADMIANNVFDSCDCCGKDIRNGVVGHCACCGAEIRSGNACIEFRRVIAQRDFAENGSYMEHTIDDDVVVLLCADCASNYSDPKAVRNELATFLDIYTREENPVEGLGVIPLEDEGNKCSWCGKQFLPGNAVLYVEMLISQVDRERDGSNLYTPIRSDELYTACAHCGGNLDAEFIKDAVEDMIKQHGGRFGRKYDVRFDGITDKKSQDESDEQPILTYYGKSPWPGLNASFGDIPSAMEYVIERLITDGHDYLVNIRGGWEIEANLAACFQVVSEHKVFDNGNLNLTIHLAFDPESETTENMIKFMEFPFFRHFFRYVWNDIPCFAFRCGTDKEKLARIARLLLIEVFGYTSAADIECNIFDEGVLPFVNHE
jgi:hypothetical protein